MDYMAVDEDQLNMKENEIFFIMKILESGWCYAVEENGNDGWIPSNYLKEYNLDLDKKQKQDITNDKMDNYAVNKNKYLDMILPPDVIPAVVVSDNGLNEYSDDSSIDQALQTTTGQNTTI
eukprot:228240_1